MGKIKMRPTIKNKIEKLKITYSDLLILKAYMQSQMLLETLDDVQDESRLNIKHSTINYKGKLEGKINEIIKNTFNSNPNVFESILKDMRKGNDVINCYFKII